MLPSLSACESGNIILGTLTGVKSKCGSCSENCTAWKDILTIGGKERCGQKMRMRGVVRKREMAVRSRIRVAARSRSCSSNIPHCVLQVVWNFYVEGCRWSGATSNAGGGRAIIWVELVGEVAASPSAKEIGIVCSRA